VLVTAQGDGMLRRELIFLHSASGDGCNDRPLLLATQEDFYRPVCIGSTLRPCGTTGSTRLLLDGPINSESSKGYIEHFLVPTLMPGDIVIRTISAATRAMRCAGPFAPWARGSLLAALQF
jgi:hypothetical protein